MERQKSMGKTDYVAAYTISVPYSDRPIRRSRIKYALSIQPSSAPSHNVHTSGVATQGIFKPARGDGPYTNSGIF